MFMDSSDEEDKVDQNLNNALEKGYKVNVAQVDVMGYYQPKSGEVIKDKYKVLSIAGKGVFSCVVKALDITSPQPKEVAIKIIRKIDITRQSGEKEIEVVT
mmetsp:Transcript_12625/g.12438  ORF Transcript_12625/g.12438 Transcript_12625/m.12438 type:complete len:101 (+) Transcript_12625:32-334(+)